MQYGHLPPTLQERRDDNNASLGQALGTHLGYRPTDYRNLSTSPPSHPQPTSSHSPLAAFNVAPTTSPNIKRKHVDSSVQQVIKRGRRELDDADPYDLDPGGQGAKHWTDEEKSKLFNWLMGVGQDEHWNALRATKNSCLRECAMDVFGSKKTYQALKGCYERNFNLFKQIYAFEQFHAPNNNLSHLSEADRLREYERRLAAARKQGCDVGNITARTIEHWHRRGWYELFYRRWHGDPATTRPSQSRNNNSASNNQGGPPDDTDPDDHHHHDHQHTPSAPQQQQQQAQQVQQQQQQGQPPPPPHHQQQHQSTNTPNTTTNTNTNANPTATSTGLDFPTTDPTTLTNGISGFTPHLTYISPHQTLRDNPLVSPSPATVPTGPTNSSSMHTGGATTSSALSGGGSGGGLGGGGGGASMTNGNPNTASSSQHAPHLFGGVGSGTNASHGGLTGTSGGAHQGLGGPTSTSSTSIGAGPHSSGNLTTSGPSSLPPSSSSSSSSSSGLSATTGLSSSSNDPPVVNITMTQNMLSAYLQFLQVQTQTGKMKLEYLRRREEREEKEMVQRRELERMKLEREAAEFEHTKHSATTKQKADRAIELLSNPSIDATVKHAASEFLKKLFMTD